MTEHSKMDVNRMFMAQQQRDALILKVASDIFAGVMSTEITKICAQIKEKKAKGDESEIQIEMEIGLPIKMSLDAAKTFVKAIS